MADCPDANSALAEEAFERLATAEVVLETATDGGYYWIRFLPSGCGPTVDGQCVQLADDDQVAHDG
jgi:hypothetical protein